MNVIIMRHGEAMPYQQDDKSRHLTRFGKTQAEFAGRRLSEYLQINIETPEIEQVVVSPYVRTQETFLEVKKHLNFSSKTDSSLITPEGHADDVADLIHGFAHDDNPPKNLMFISHMPLVSLLADKICPSFNARIFSTADILIVDYEPQRSAGTQFVLIQSIK